MVLSCCCCVVCVFCSSPSQLSPRGLVPQIWLARMQVAPPSPVAFFAGLVILVAGVVIPIVFMLIQNKPSLNAWRRSE